MNAPLRIFAYHEDDAKPSWWLTDDMGQTFIKWGGDWRMASRSELILEGDGQNDPQATTWFPMSRRAAYQAARK